NLEPVPKDAFQERRHGHATCRGHALHPLFLVDEDGVSVEVNIVDVAAQDLAAAGSVSTYFSFNCSSVTQTFTGSFSAGKLTVRPPLRMNVATSAPCGICNACCSRSMSVRSTPPTTLLA